MARLGDVTPGPLAVTVLGEHLVLWRKADGALTAARDRCPHREAPLSHGRVVEAGLQCPYHGWAFGASGACVRIPSAPQVASLLRGSVQARPHTERCGEV